MPRPPSRRRSASAKRLSRTKRARSKSSKKRVYRATIHSGKEVYFKPRPSDRLYCKGIVLSRNDDAVEIQCLRSYDNTSLEGKTFRVSKNMVKDGGDVYFKINQSERLYCVGILLSPIDGDIVEIQCIRSLIDISREGKTFMVSSDMVKAIRPT